MGKAAALAPLLTLHTVGRAVGTLAIEPAIQSLEMLAGLLGLGYTASARMLGFPADALDEPIAQGARREQEVMESVRPRVPGEQIEQLGQVLAE